MNRCKKQEKGITLMVLVVTIIVLLILAGVVINLTMGNNGLFSRARDATQSYLQAEAKEKLELVLTNISSDKSLREIDNDYIDTELEKEGVLVLGDAVIVDDWQFEIDRNELKIVNTLGKITNKEELLIPKIKKGQAIIDYTQIEVRIELTNKVNSKITYGIKRPNEDNEIQKIETNNTSYIFSNLEEGTEYEVTIDVMNEYGTASKSKNITTLYHSVPKMTENSNKIVQSGFFENYQDRWGKSVWYQAFDRDVSTYSSTIKPNYESIGSYIGYDFERPTLITEVTGKIRMLSYKIQYSDDLEQWSDAITANSSGSDAGDNFSHKIDETIGEHRYWRLYVNGGQKSSDWGALVWDLQFNGKQEKETINII